MIAHLLILSVVALGYSHAQDIFDGNARLYVPDGRCPPAEQHHLLPHESDCTKYYYCEYGQRYKEPRDCADGTAFSYERQVCVHRSQVNCEQLPSPSPSTASPTTNAPAPSPTTLRPGNGTLPNGCPADFDVDWRLPHECDCDKYYRCMFGKLVVKECPAGLHFNPVTQLCDRPENVGCVPGSPPSGTSTSTARPSPSPTPGPAPSTSAPEMLPNGCPSDFDILWLLPHESDCNKFYQCDSGDKVLRSCPEGLHFNPVLQICDWPSDAGCVGSGPEPSTSGPSTGSPSSTTAAPGPSPSTSPPVPLPNGCPADFDILWLLPHESDCNKFYQCDSGEKILRSCPEGLHFNPVLQICDWPSDAGCVGSGPGPSTSGPSTGSPSSTTAAPGPSPSTSAPVPLPNGCPADFDINWHLPHESDCNQFYQCDKGEKVLKICPAGMHFNPVKQICDWPWDAGCEVGAPEPSTSGPSTVSPSSTSSAPGPSPTSGPSPSTAAPGPSPTSGPSPPPSPPETLPNGCPSDFDINWHLPHESDCSKFYQCDHGEKVLKICPAGLHFNPVLQVCDWPWDAGCEVGAPEPSTSGPSTGSPSSTSSAPGPSPTAGPSPSTAAPGPSPTPGPSPPTSPPVPLPNGCPSDFDINWHLPHESNCSKFYQCDHGEKVLKSCPAGLHFNPVLQICDWPWDAGCEGSAPGPSTSGPSTGAPSSTSSAPGPSPTAGPSPSTAAPGPSPSTAAPGPSPSTAAPGPSPSTAAPGPSPSTAAPGPSPTPGPSPPTSPPVPLPNGCPSDFDINWHLPHESNCSKFYQCDHGEKVLKSCPAGLHFNPVLQICDWPWDAGCEGNGSSTPGPSTAAPGPSPSTSAPGPSPSTPAPGPSPSTPAPGPSPSTPAPGPSPSTSAPGGTTAAPIETDRCKTECHVPHWPHETDCDKFWRCEGNQKVLGVCPEGLFFNKDTQTCDFMCNVDCVRSVVQATARSEGLSVFLPWDKVDEFILRSKQGEFPEFDF